LGRSMTVGSLRSPASRLRCSFGGCELDRRVRDAVGLSVAVFALVFAAIWDERAPPTRAHTALADASTPPFGEFAERPSQTRR
jgi:hypothetical protein